MKRGPVFTCLLGSLSLLISGACGALPAVFDPHGSNAAETAQLGWVLFCGGGVIFALVAALAAYAVFAAPASRAWLGRQRFVVGAGIVFPIVTLTALLIYTLKVSGDLEGATAPLKVEIVGHMWWWQVRYVDASGETAFETANEMHIPVGRTIEFSLESADVLHSFWVPQLAGKLDLIPGRVNVLRLRADRAGVFRGQCAEYCGAQHAKMAFHVVADDAPEFAAWFKAQRLASAMPATPAAETSDLAAGRELFLIHCGVCHTVRGTAARGQLGPDLTHVGSRRALAAGTLENNAGTIAAWIAASQHLKPENKMPSFDRFAGQELHSLAAYVESLK